MPRPLLTASLLAALVLLAPAPAAAQAPAQPAQPAQPTAPAQPTPPDAATARTKPQRPSKRQGRTSDRTAPATESKRAADDSRASRDPGPTRQELALTANLLGGYDDNLTAGLGTGSGTVPTAMASGTTGYFDTALNYFRGNTLRSLRVGTVGTLRAYPGYLNDPAPGGNASVEAKTNLGRTHTFGVNGQVRYEPLFTVGWLGTDTGPLPPGTGGTVPVTGLLERRAWTYFGSAYLERQWSRKDSTRVSYAYSEQNFIEDGYGDNFEHSAQAEYRRRLGRGVRARASYRFVDGEYTSYNSTTRPEREQTIEGGPEIETAISRRNRLYLSLAAGASYVESVGSATNEPYDFWVPSGSAQARLDFSSRWQIAAGYQRGFSILQGITDELYTTDTASVSVGGLVFPRLDVRVGGTYSNGQTPVASGATDDYEIYGASVQARFMLTSTVGAFGGYYFYRHRYSNPDALPTGFPAAYDRNAFRVGLSMFVPLVGQTQAPRMPATP